MTRRRRALAWRRRQLATYLDIARISQWFDRMKTEMFEAHDIRDITPAQSNVLLVLFQENVPLTAREIATRLDLSEPTVSHLVRALEGAGWVRRGSDPNDARARPIELTKKSRAALPKLATISNAALDRSFLGFDEAEFARFSAFIARVRTNLVGPMPKE